MRITVKLRRALAAILTLIPILAPTQAGAVAVDAISNTFLFPLITPGSTAVSPDGTIAIVSSTSSNTVYRINLLTNTVIDTVTILNAGGGYRSTIDANGRYAYLLDILGNQIYKMDLTNDSITATITGVPSPRGIAAAPDGSYMIAVSNQVNANYYKIDATTNSVTTYSGILPTNPFEVAISPDGTKAVFGSYANNRFMLVDLTTNTLIRSYTASYSGVPVWTPDSSAIYACNQQGAQIYKIDPSSTTITTYSIPGGTCTSIAMSPNGSYIVVASTNNSVYRILTSTPSTVAATTTGFSSLPWDVKIGSNSTNGEFAIITDRNNKAVYRIYEGVGSAPIAASLNLTAASLVATYRSALSITASSNTAGKVTFYADGKKIPGCIARTTTLNITHDVTCLWKPAVHKSYQITANVTPSSGSYLSGTSPRLGITVVKRSNMR
ncbi:MAG: hypothetical protein ACKOXI_00600 [Candidatus Planktophila sp.]